MVGMRKLVFTVALLAVVPVAMAQEKDMPKGGPKAMPPAVTGPAPEEGSGVVAPAPGAACPAPATVKVCKLVPTQVQETRTVMKPVQKTECYTAYRTEYVQEKKCVPVTTYKQVTETVMETRTKCIKVPVYEEKIVMKKHRHIEWVTEYKEKCKISFQKECKTIGGCCDKGDGCCDKGGFSFPVYKPYLDTKVVACKKPVCRTECVPVVKKHCTYRTEVKTECVPVTKTKCVPCTVTKEICCTKPVCVPYQATRCVTVMEPCTETVTVCKMVPTWVEVPCAPACPPACHEPAPACHGPTGPACHAPAAPACGDPCGKEVCCDKGFGGDDCCGKLHGCCEKLKECCYKIKGCCEKIKACLCCCK